MITTGAHAYWLVVRQSSASVDRRRSVRVPLPPAKPVHVSTDHEDHPQQIHGGRTTRTNQRSPACSGCLQVQGRPTKVSYDTLSILDIYILQGNAAT